MSNCLLPLPAPLLLLLVSMSMLITPALAGDHSLSKSSLSSSTVSHSSKILHSSLGNSPRSSGRKLSPMLLAMTGGLVPTQRCKGDETYSNCMGSSGACCNERCVDVYRDLFHCGICNRGCQNGESCCRGICVDLNTNRRNCGECGLKCPKRVQCQFGICGYAGAYP